MHTAVQDTSGESQRMPIGGCCAPDVCFWCACMTRLRGRVSRHRSDSSSRPIQALAPVNDTSEQSLIPLTYRPPLPTSRHPRRASQICSFSAVTANDDWTREPRRDAASAQEPLFTANIRVCASNVSRFRSATPRSRLRRVKPARHSSPATKREMMITKTMSAQRLVKNWH